MMMIMRHWHVTSVSVDDTRSTITAIDKSHITSYLVIAYLIKFWALILYIYARYDDFQSI